MLDAIAPSGPEPAGRAGVRPAPDGLERLEDLHRPDLRRAGDRPAGKAAASRSNGSRPGREAPGHGRDQVLDGARSARAGTGAARGRCPAGRPGRGRCAGRPRSSRSRRGPWRWPGARAASARSASGVAARGRVPLIGSVVTLPVPSTDRKVQARPRRSPAATPAPTPSADGRGRGTPRTGPDRRSGGTGRAATGRPGTGPGGGGRGWPGRSRRRAIARRIASHRLRTPAGRGSMSKRRPVRGRVGWRSAVRRRVRSRSRTGPEASRRGPPRSPSSARPARQASPVRRFQAIAQS